MFSKKISINYSKTCKARDLAQTNKSNFKERIQYHWNCWKAKLPKNGVLGATWSMGGVPAHSRGWDGMGFKVPPKPNHSMIVWPGEEQALPMGLQSLCSSCCSPGVGKPQGWHGTGWSWKHNNLTSWAKPPPKIIPQLTQVHETCKPSQSQMLQGLRRQSGVQALKDLGKTGFCKTSHCHLHLPKYLLSGPATR